MTTFAERFVAEVHNKPFEDVNIEEIAANCNLLSVDEDIGDDGERFYYFADNSKAGLRPKNMGEYWDAWVPKFVRS